MFSQRNLHKKMSFMSLVSFILTFLVDNRLFKLIVVYILLSEGKPAVKTMTMEMTMISISI